MSIRATITPQKHVNQDVLAMRIDAAEKSERAERAQQQQEKAVGHSVKETDLIRRINTSSETDTLEVRRQQELQELLRAENEQLKEEAETEQDYNKTLREELGAYL